MSRITGGKWLKMVIVLAGLVLGLGLLALVSARFIVGQWLGPRSLARTIVNTAQSVIHRDIVSSSNRGDFADIIFLHHSTGNNLIEQGGVRERFTQAGYRFWDHSFNFQGLRDPAGRYTGYSYSVPNDNTDPDGLVRLFSQQVYGLPLNTLSALLQHEVIVFKSCFAPANNIASDQQLETYKAWYMGIRDVMDRYPDKLFIVVTDPPLNPAETTPQEAARARAFANWLQSDEFLKGHPNVSTFDLYGSLAQGNTASAEYGMLRVDYREGSDSHPNQIANVTIGPMFADFIIRVTEEYRAVVTSR